MIWILCAFVGILWISIGLFIGSMVKYYSNTRFPMSLVLIFLLPSIVWAHIEVTSVSGIEHPIGMIDRVSKRTVNSLTFEQGYIGSGKMQVIISAEPVCYDSAGAMKLIDLTPHIAKTAGYEHQVNVGLSMFEYDSVGSILYMKGASSFTVSPCNPKVPVRFDFHSNGLKATYTIIDEKSLHLRWLVKGDVKTAQRKISPFTAIGADGKVVEVLTTWIGDSLIAEVGAGKLPILLDPTINDTSITGTSGQLGVNILGTWLENRNRTYSTGTPGTALSGILSATTNGPVYQNRLAYSFPMISLPLMTTVDSAYFYWKSGSSVYAPVSATICKGTFSGTPDSTWYNKFIGWAASGAYAVNAFSNDSLIIANTNTLYSIALNDSGKAAVKLAAHSDTLRIMLLENHDKIGIGDVGLQSYASANAALMPYLVIYYTPLGASTIISHTDSIVALVGNITGASGVTYRGFHFGRTASYGDSVYETGTFGNGIYSLPVTGLKPDSLYYFRAFVGGSDVQVVGAQQTFTVRGVSSIVHDTVTIHDTVTVHDTTTIHDTTTVTNTVNGGGKFSGKFGGLLH
jgi:hypothetical protein